MVAQECSTGIAILFWHNRALIFINTQKWEKSAIILANIHHQQRP